MRLNRDRLVSAALDLVDVEGAEALSMRVLADRVDRQVSSLYNHVSGRDDLIEAMRARIVTGIDVSAFAESSGLAWDEALEVWARSYLRVFAAHPNLIRLLATTSIRDRSTYAMYDAVVAGLRRGGWPESEVIAVVRTVEAHVLGSALDMVAPGDLLAQEAADEQFPAVHAALAAHNADSYGAEPSFELGLAALLDGLRSRLAARVA
ncbi:MULTISPECIES: TetR/AcrR family transcriptional regulator [Brevibacterium]|nr:TetR/AcrR family transcriptional regulator C-terminal domain-containing protein [Brevibacterium casei]MCT1549964.1 TetR/AcrR family transcriptional regulator C-terminal domain-containing protein [Brevibacterium casei]MCT1560887.1 TetR/AcrR family transcriptional regulator C-terminal domain-containing protein [Brevibacterium casei]MCT2208086.1 TetR/AcrR family transcriptional regulator C-terminal domain-containing protein [Brevibacterium casei]VEW14339.1 Tetracycline repressor protein class E